MRSPSAPRASAPPEPLPPCTHPPHAPARHVHPPTHALHPPPHTHTPSSPPTTFTTGGWRTRPRCWHAPPPPSTTTPYSSLTSSLTWRAGRSGAAKAAARSPTRRERWVGLGPKAGQTLGGSGARNPSPPPPQHTPLAGRGGAGSLPFCRAARLPHQARCRAARQRHRAHHRCGWAGGAGRAGRGGPQACPWGRSHPTHPPTPPPTPARRAVGVITPYREQRRLLQEKFGKVCGREAAAEVRARWGSVWGGGGGGGAWCTPTMAAAGHQLANLLPYPPLRGRCSSRRWTRSRGASWMW